MLRAAARLMVEREFSKDTLLRLESDDKQLGEALWEKTTAAGWPGILVPPKYGGEGGSLTDAAVLLEELGRASGSGLVLFHGGPWRVIAFAGWFGGAAESRPPWRGVGRYENFSRGHRGPLRLEEGVDSHEGGAAGRRVLAPRNVSSSSRTPVTPTFSCARRPGRRRSRPILG